MIEIPARVMARYRNRTQLPMRGFRPSNSGADASTTGSENDPEIGSGDRLLLQHIKEQLSVSARGRYGGSQSDASKDRIEIPSKVLERYRNRTQLPLRGFSPPR